ncbi:MAG: nitroreductase/quinone reductase family protein [Acidimicrobiales bacterium]
MVLETTGRKSRQAPTGALVAARLGKQLTVSTVRPDSLWMKNVDAEPNVSVWLNGSKHAGTAVTRPGPLSTARVTLP